MKTILVPLLLLATLQPAADDAPRRRGLYTASISDVRLAAALPTISPAGQPIILKITLSNGSAAPVLYDQAEPIAHLTLETEEGRPIPLTRERQRNPFAIPIDPPAVLAPGKEVAAEYDLTQWFDLRAPGTYSLTIRRSYNERDPDEWGVLEICGIDFSIGPRKRAMGRDIAPVPISSPPPASADVQAFVRGAYRLVDQRSALTVELRQRLTEEIDPTRKAAIFFLIGQYRLEDLAPVLAQNIAFEATNFRSDLQKNPRWSKHPAAHGLFEIGIASVPYMIENLSSSDDRQVRELSAFVLRSVMHRSLRESNRHTDGQDLAESVLSKAIDQEADARQRDRLSQALKDLEQRRVKK